MAFDPENDSPDEFEDITLNDIEEDDFDAPLCAECGEPLSFGECTNTACPESPDFADDDIDLDDEGDNDA